MLKLENVSKIYKIGTFGGQDLHAVNNVNFDIPEGRVTALIGESGSGKSTIGKMILRLISISSGTITFKDQDLSKLKAYELKKYYCKVQGVFQDPFSSLNPIFKADRIFSIIKDEYFPQTSHSEWEGKVKSALIDVGLNPEQVLGKYPHQLSGGQLQRFLIARALLLDIEFLVADEIISMLDASTRIDVLNLLADLKTRGLAILFITHDLSLANYISERAIILYRGCVAEMGPTESVFNTPLHPYTQMLIASVPRLDQKWCDEVVPLKLNAKKSDYTGGCPYYDRCPIGSKALGCDKFNPPLLEVAKDHFVACFRVTEKMN
jgi:peptide/nickel transport system ATP-binding protein